MKGKCQNCGQQLEDSFLTHCSNECRFEDYLKSQSGWMVDNEVDLNQFKNLGYFF